MLRSQENYTIVIDMNDNKTQPFSVQKVQECAQSTNL